MVAERLNNKRKKKSQKIKPLKSYDFYHHKDSMSPYRVFLLGCNPKGYSQSQNISNIFGLAVVIVENQGNQFQIIS